MLAQRNTAFIVLIFLSMMVLFYWQSDKTQAEIAKHQPKTTVVSNTNAINTDNIVKIETDLYSLDVSLDSGDIVKAELKDQKQTVDSDENFKLLRITPNFKYIARSDVVIGDKSFASEAKYSTSQKAYSMDSDNLVVTFQGKNKDGVTVQKDLSFTKGSHVITTTYKIGNVATKTTVATESMLEQTAIDPDAQSGMFGTSAYRGAAYSTPDSNYTKTSLTDIAELANADRINSTKGGWVSMIQHYFVAAWVGTTDTANTILFSGADSGKTAIATIKSAPIAIEPGATITISNRLWLGPKYQDEMKLVAPHLDLTVDYGWLWFISIFFFKLMQFIHTALNFIGISDVFGAWGFSIILLTLLVRGVLYPLTKKQYVSMAKMRLLAPKLNAIKERYKDDRQKFSQEMMRLYQTEHVNPLGGCLPILIQMPIFIALYWTFMESTELRHSPFIFWIKDLSIHDPYFVLPIMMGITMLLIQKMSPTPVTDPMQKKIMMIMPIVFTAMFCTFPAGLTLYWVVSNIVTIVQQIMIFRALEKRGLSMKATVKK